jgi:flagellar biosynthesis GTPase FlhF
LGGRLNEFPGARARLVFTDLDEERRWGKLWNFVLGTDYALRFLSAGQYIPGNFFEPTPELVLARQFPRTRGADGAGDARETRVGRASAK